MLQPYISSQNGPVLMEAVRSRRPGCGSGRGVNNTCRDITKLCGSYVRGQHGENNPTRTVTGREFFQFVNQDVAFIAAVLFQRMTKSEKILLQTRM